MITVSEHKSFALTNRFFSYVFRVTPEGLLEHIYYGSPLNAPHDAPVHHVRTERGCVTHFKGHEDLNLNDMPQEYPCFGTSDFRFPAFHGVNADGNAVFCPVYKSHRTVKEKPRLTGMPSARGGDSETLIITFEDVHCGLRAELLYSIYADHGVLVRSVRFVNVGREAITLEHVFSSALDLPAGEYELLHLHGTWAREFNEARMDMPHGRFVIDSARGTSSAAHNPFMAVLQKGAGEDHGAVYGLALMYSGNFSMSAERGEFGDVRLLAGINPFGFSWRLSPGETFETPEALHVYSGNGLRAMSHIWHAFVRDKISPERFKRVPRPTYLNTWEAAYFDINEDKVLALADKANEIGVDMIVLDDGWFEGRQDAASSLGDWTADKARFPSGIPSLAAKIKAKGLKFGLWFEPEMVSSNSRLFETHPDWVLRVPGRISSLGRNQLTLDLSRTEVVDAIYDKLDAILSCGDIDYVKWDMNRNMTETGSATLPKDQQREVSHRYILGLYDLLSRLTKAYPDILFENCASGGNRFDLCMLSFMPQGWVSDMSDPIGRLEIINSASYIFPLDTMAAYIGPSPNHINGRLASLETRFNAGVFCAARGVSLGEAEIDAHKEDLHDLMAFAKETAPDMLGGRFDRLEKSTNHVCWQYISRDGGTVYLAFFHILSAPNLSFERARLVGLDPLANYTLQDDGAVYQGDALMQSGMPLPYVTMLQNKDDVKYMPKGDFTSRLFVFKREKRG